MRLYFVLVSLAIAACVVGCLPNYKNVDDTGSFAPKIDEQIKSSKKNSAAAADVITNTNEANPNRPTNMHYSAVAESGAAVFGARQPTPKTTTTTTTTTKPKTKPTTTTVSPITTEEMSEMLADYRGAPDYYCPEDGISCQTYCERKNYYSGYCDGQDCHCYGKLMR